MGRKKGYKERKRGESYRRRVEAVNRIYERWRKEGLSNREIWYRHIYPVYGMCERTFYNLLKASSGKGDAFGTMRQGNLFDGIDDE